MNVIISTSDRYAHCLPLFFYLYNKYWGEPAELVGYTKPEIPDNFTFHSMGEDRGPKYWSTDLLEYFKDQPDFFVWMMEDTFIKGFDKDKFNFAWALTIPQIGRIDLTKDVQKRHHTTSLEGIVYALSDKYRQSTQPSIWNKEFLLMYLKEGMTPWEFETQPTQDAYQIVGLKDYPLFHNEGVNKRDIFKFDINGIDDPEALRLCGNYI